VKPEIYEYNGDVVIHFSCALKEICVQMHDHWIYRTVSRPNVFERWLGITWTEKAEVAYRKAERKLDHLAEAKEVVSSVRRLQ
jgi:hypothetical protein